MRRRDQIDSMESGLIDSDLHPYAIKCDPRGCRSILSDGSLADDNIAKPEGTR